MCLTLNEHTFEFYSFTCYVDGMFQSKFPFKDNTVLPYYLTTVKLIVLYNKVLSYYLTRVKLSLVQTSPNKKHIKKTHTKNTQTETDHLANNNYIYTHHTHA